jgi:hypothetical protein
MFWHLNCIWFPVFPTVKIMYWLSQLICRSHVHTLAFSLLSWSRKQSSCLVDISGKNNCRNVQIIKILYRWMYRFLIYLIVHVINYNLAVRGWVGQPVVQWCRTRIYENLSILRRSCTNGTWYIACMYVSWLHQDWSGTAVCVVPPEDEQVMLETCWGPWFLINWIKSASHWFHYTDILWCTVNKTLSLWNLSNMWIVAYLVQSETWLLCHTSVFVRLEN